MILHKTYRYDFSHNGVNCHITEEPDSKLFLPFVNNKWTEDKESNLHDAIDSCLKRLGIPKKEREQIKHTVK